MGLPDSEVHNALSRRQASLVSGLQDFLRQPGFSNTGEGIDESAGICAGIIADAGGEDVEIVETGGEPAVYGIFRSKQPEAGTILCYSLYDMVPVAGDRWRSNPLGAEIVRPESIGLAQQVGPVICSRGTHNQRGPMWATLQGIKAMLDVQGDLPVNVVVCWEGEEEQGSPNLSTFLDKKRVAIEQCEGVWVPGISQTQAGVAMLAHGFLGACVLELHCRGGEWGGSSEDYLGAPHVGWVDAPVIRLAKAVASFFDEDHNVAIDGLLETVPPLSPADARLVDELLGSLDQAYEDEMKQILGVQKFRGGKRMKDNLRRIYEGILGNVAGINAGYSGTGYSVVLPQAARAKLDFEFPPGLEWSTVVERTRDHLDARGYDEITIENVRGYDGFRSAGASNDALGAANRAASEQFSNAAVEAPWYSWGCPIGVLEKQGLGIPTVYGGAGHGERPHQPDEYITVDSVLQMAQFTPTFLHHYAEGRG